MPTSFPHIALSKLLLLLLLFNCYKTVTDVTVTTTIATTTTIKLSYYCGTDHFAADI